MITGKMHEARMKSVTNRLVNAVRFNPSRDPVMSATKEKGQRRKTVNGDRDICGDKRGRVGELA